MLTLDPKVKTELLHKTLSPSETNDIINAVIDCQINFFKLKNWTNWEHNHQCDTSDIECEIDHLRQVKNELREQIQLARQAGKKIELKNKLELNIID